MLAGRIGKTDLDVSDMAGKNPEAEENKVKLPVIVLQRRTGWEVALVCAG